MATGGSKEKNKGAGSQLKIDGIGGAVIFTGGAMVGAAVLYGMKKLYDHFKSKKDQEQLEKEAFLKKVRDLSDTEPEPSSRSILNNAPPDYPSPEEQSISSPESHGDVSLASLISPQSDGATSVLSVGSLHDNLFEYYVNYVDIPEADYQIAMTVVDDVKRSFRSVVEELMPNCPLGEMIDIGAASEGLAVVRPDYFQVGLQLSLPPQLWQFVDAGQTLLSAYGYQMVKRTHLEFFARGTSFYDKYLTGEYLCPVKLKAVFLDLTNRISNWGCRHVIQSAVIGPEVRLIVRYGTDMSEKALTIEFIPSVHIRGIQVLAEPHPKCKNNSCYENLWMQSFRAEEIRHLTGWRPTAQVFAPVSDSTEVKDIGGDAEVAHYSKAPGNEINKDLPTIVISNDEMSETESDKTSMEQDQPVSQAVLEAEGPANVESMNVNVDQEISIEGCQLMCLKILEAIRLNHPAQLRIIDAYAVRTIVMMLMTLEDSWYSEQLSERFLDTLKLLEECLRTRRLPHMFCPQVNLLEDFDSEITDQTRDFIASIIGNNQFSTLLKNNY